MSQKKISLAITLAATVAMLTACGEEELHDKSYYQALGQEKSIEAFMQCGIKRKALIDAKDANGVDKYTKSNALNNCKAAFLASAREQAKEIRAQTDLLLKTTTKEEYNAIKDKFGKVIDDRLTETLKQFPEWFREPDSFELRQQLLLWNQALNGMPHEIERLARRK